MVIDLYLPIRIVSTMNKREHWTTRSTRTKAHRVAARLSVASAPEWPRYKSVPVIYLPVVVTLTRIAPRELDDDNLSGGFKAVRDGVADALGVDDKDKRVTWRYAQRTGKPKEYGMTITIQGKA